MFLIPSELARGNKCLTRLYSYSALKLRLEGNGDMQ